MFVWLVKIKLSMRDAYGAYPHLQAPICLIICDAHRKPTKVLNISVFKERH